MASAEQPTLTLDGVALTTRADRRRFPGASLLPAVDRAFERLRGDLADWPNPHPGGRSPTEEEYSRCLDPAKYALLAARADAWVEAVVASGLGTTHVPEAGTVRWAGEQVLVPTRVTVVRGARPGTQPIVVGVAPSQGAEEAFVQVGVGDPAEVLGRQPDCGCDACDTGSADLLETLDSAFVLALSGGAWSGARRPTDGVRPGWSRASPGSEVPAQAMVSPPSTGIICPVT